MAKANRKAKKNKVTIYCVKGRHKLTVTDPEITTLKAGRSKVRMKAYRALCPTHNVWCYKLIGKA